MAKNQKTSQKTTNQNWGSPAWHGREPCTVTPSPTPTFPGPDTVPRKKRVAFVETVMGMLGLSVVAHEQIADILGRLGCGRVVLEAPQT